MRHPVQSSVRVPRTIERFRTVDTVETVEADETDETVEINRKVQNTKS